MKIWLLLLGWSLLYKLCWGRDMSCIGLWTASKVEQLVKVMSKGTWESWRSQLYSWQNVVGNCHGPEESDSSQVSKHGYSNGTGIEVIQEILSLISLRGSVYQDISDHVMIDHDYQHHQNCILYKIQQQTDQGSRTKDQGTAFTYAIAFCIDLSLMMGEAEGISLRRIKSAFSPLQETALSIRL